MNFRKMIATTMLLTMTASVASVFAQNRAGVDRPIRVGMFKGTGTGGKYWHTNIHTSHTVVANILANPTGSNLGDSVIVPTKGFTFYSQPIALNTGGTAECTGNGCGPNAGQIAQFIAALDTLDVMIMSSVVDFGSRVPEAQRPAFGTFWSTKGYVAIHAITDSYGTWAPLDTIHGARFRGHPAEQTGTIRRDSVFETEAAWKFLNKGLFSGAALDTNFYEEWFYFTTTGAAIRATSGLKPTMKLVESSIANPGTQSAMGDHPHSWYRQLPTGGRFFYTAVGHRSQVWETTRFFRRQVYNAILWTAKYDSLSTSTAIAPGRMAPGSASDYSRISTSAGALTVTLIPGGSHSVELLGLDGKRVAFQKGEGSEMAYNFTGLRAGTYAMSVTTSKGRSHRLVAVQ